MDPSLLNSTCMKGVTLIQVGKMNYRVNTQSLNMNNQQKGNSKTITPLKELIEVSVPISSKLIGFVIGKQGSTLKSIRSSTRAKIKIEKDPNDEELELAIISGTQVQVDQAKSAILDIIEKTNAPVKASHFLSLPITNVEIQEKVKKLQNHILHLRLEDIESEMMQPYPSIHLTLGTLFLKSSDDIKKLNSDLESIQKDIWSVLNNEPLILNLSKLKVMGSNPGKTRVIYADVQEFNSTNQLTQPKRLKLLSESIWTKLNELGYTNLNQKSQIFHCTILKSKKSGAMFDGRPILEVYSKMNLGSFTCQSLQVGQMGSLGSNLNYNIVADVDLPKE